MRNPIALTSVTYNALNLCLHANQTRGVSHIKLPSEGYRAIGGGGVAAIVSRYRAIARH